MRTTQRRAGSAITRVLAATSGPLRAAAVLGGLLIIVGVVLLTFGAGRRGPAPVPAV
jgi:hypothetical protein